MNHVNIRLTLNIGCDAPSYRLGQLQILPDKPAPSLYGRGPALQVMLVANLAKVIVAAYSSHLSSLEQSKISITWSLWISMTSMHWVAYIEYPGQGFQLPHQPKFSKSLVTVSKSKPTLAIFSSSTGRSFQPMSQASKPPPQRAAVPRREHSSQIWPVSVNRCGSKL